jgi:hypothetical protein
MREGDRVCLKYRDQIVGFLSFFFQYLLLLQRNHEMSALRRAVQYRPYRSNEIDYAKLHQSR